METEPRGKPPSGESRLETVPGLLSQRNLWVYVSAVLLAVPLIEVPSLTSFLVSRFIPAGLLRYLLLWIVEAGLLVAWIEGVRLALRRGWKPWSFLLVPVVVFLLEIALISLGSYVLR